MNVMIKLIDSWLVLIKLFMELMRIMMSLKWILHLLLISVYKVSLMVRVLVERSMLGLGIGWWIYLSYLKIKG